MRRKLRSGYTTGACAAAAAKGAALLLRYGRQVDQVTINLPLGDQAIFAIHHQLLEGGAARCSVIKDAGDDPDITNGAEIVATVQNAPLPPFDKGEERHGEVIIAGGEGVGRVTKPGLAVSVGEWAINPVPHRMIEEAVREVYPVHDSRFVIYVTISIPDGAERAKKTLNERLGIVGGLSILGTTGIVRPISARAWTDTIDTAIDVALASGSGTVVLSTGRSSELVAQRRLGIGGQRPGSGGSLPEEAFVMMGDHVGHALRSCRRKGVKEVILACQFAKLLKIACGHEQTHVSSSELDLEQMIDWLRFEPGAASLEPLARVANTARQLLEGSGNSAPLVALVCCRARGIAQQLAPDTVIKVLLAGYDSTVLYFA